jgi:D-amino-acid dehydrogenase
MRIAVIGAGVIGVTSARELAADGHHVTVFERRSSVAVEASFAHAGLISPATLTPWAAPGRPGQLLRSLFGRHPMLRLSLGGPTSASPGWLWRWWRACAAPAHRANRARMQRLVQFSRERLHEVTASLKLDYERADGHLVLWRSAADSASMAPTLSMLHDQGVRFNTLDAASCLAAEPGLNPATELHGGVHFAHEEVGNCRQFAISAPTARRHQPARLAHRDGTHRGLSGH